MIDLKGRPPESPLTADEIRQVKAIADAFQRFVAVLWNAKKVADILEADRIVDEIDATVDL